MREELTRRVDPAQRLRRHTDDVMPGTDGRPTCGRAVGPQQEGDRVCIAPVGRPPAIWAKVMVFAINTGLPFDAVYLEFINQFLDMVMAALLRVDAAQVREAASLERDSVLPKAPVPAALLVGQEHRYQVANAAWAHAMSRCWRSSRWRPRNRWRSSSDMAIPVCLRRTLRQLRRQGKPRR